MPFRVVESIATGDSVPTAFCCETGCFDLALEKKLRRGLASTTEGLVVEMSKEGPVVPEHHGLAHLASIQLPA